MKSDRQTKHGVLAALGFNTYAEYLESPRWLRTRDEIFERDGHRCTECGSTTQLIVHHRTYVRVGRERPEDLTTLCHGCHAVVHNIPTHNTTGPTTGQMRILHAVARDLGIPTPTPRNPAQAGRQIGRLLWMQKQRKTAAPAAATESGSDEPPSAERPGVQPR